MEGLLKRDAVAVRGLFVYLDFKIPTQSVTDTKPVRQVLFDLYFAKRELASTCWTSQTACVLDICKQQLARRAASAILLHIKANGGGKQYRETRFGGAIS